jgi:glycosyltransferase involved in cell wall biosynthesis
MNPGQVLNLVSIITPTLDNGGAERSMVHLANALADEGLDIQLVTALNAEGVYKEEIGANTPFINLNARRQRYLPMKLHRYMMEQKPDIIISALINNWVLGVKTAMRHNSKIIATQHTVFSGLLGENSGFLSGASFLMSRKLYPRADKVVAVSQGVADDLVTQGVASAEKVRVIYNPTVSEELFKAIDEEMPMRLLSSEAPNFVAVGRLSEPKNYNDLIDAFAIVRKSTPCRLVIFGEGGKRRELEAQIKRLGLFEDVLLPGFILNPFPYVKAADCFVSSSKREGLHCGIIQALACGSTVVATDCRSGPSEILEDGKYGALVPVGDINALAGAMKEALHRRYPPNLQKKRSLAFSRENCVKLYIELFEELMTQSMKG